MPSCTSTATSGGTPVQRHQYQLSLTLPPSKKRSFQSRFCASSAVAPHAVELTTCWKVWPTLMSCQAWLNETPVFQRRKNSRP